MYTKFRTEKMSGYIDFKSILRKNRVKILKMMDVSCDIIIDHLLAENVFSKSEYDRVRKEQHRLDQNRIILDLLEEKDYDAFLEFKRVLEQDYGTGIMDVAIYPIRKYNYWDHGASSARPYYVPYPPIDYDQLNNRQPFEIFLQNGPHQLNYFDEKLLIAVPGSDSIDIVENKKVKRLFPKLKRPYGACALNDGNFAIVQPEEHRILKMTMGGQMLTCFGEKGRGIKEVNTPHRIVQCKSNGYLYIPDSTNSRIKVLDQDFKFIKHFFADDMETPFGIHVSDDDRVFVTDPFSCKLHEFAVDGTHVKSVFIPRAEGDKQRCLSGILGVDTDNFGNVLVCVFNPVQCIQVLSPDLRPITTFGENVLQGPSDVCVTPQGSIAITDLLAKKLVIYE